MCCNDTIIIALGSNCDAENNIESGKECMRKQFGDIRFSSSLHTSAIGISTGEFVNNLAIVRQRSTPDDIIRILKGIEHECGDSRELRQKGIIMLDADLLLCGGKRFHEADWSRQYIADLMRELGINVK